MQNNSILEQLKKIPYGTLVKILWLDAATVKSANMRRLPLRNDYVETRRSTVGTLVCLQQGQAQRAWHIVLEMDNTEDAGSTIRSIPVCLIYRAIAPILKAAESVEKEWKRGWKPKEKSRYWHAKRILHLKDGSVKFLD